MLVTVVSDGRVGAALVFSQRCVVRVFVCVIVRV